MTKQIKIEEFTLQQVIDNQERVIKEQKEDIERLQAQLDKEIHINRIMLNTINFYANKNFWYDRDDESGWEVAQQTLKQIEEME